MENNPIHHQKKYRVVYDRMNCIGVLTCAAFHPSRWTINEKDAKADLVGGIENKEKPGLFAVEFGEEELEGFKEAVRVCPAGVIQVYDAETGEKID